MRVAVLFLILSVAGVWAESDHGQNAGHYDYGGVRADAIEVYRQAWVEILEYGRWTEAERLYRQALALDPGFTVARSVLARITPDANERGELYRRVERERAALGPDAQLILQTYQRTLEMFAARETGVTLPEGFRQEMAVDAVRDYGAFLAKYPEEWSVRIEYVEWVHALEGPGAALQAIDTLGHGTSESYSYFPAYFYAELGQDAVAAEMSEAFARKHAARAIPQPHFLNAYVHYFAGDLDAARRDIDDALALDPRHLLAARLSARIAAAQGEAGL